MIPLIPGDAVTDEQSHDKWCPFARVAFVGNNVMNRVSSFHKELAQKSADNGDPRDLEHYQRQERDAHCIGSRCMAWRWAGYRPVGADQDEAHGYCGLAAPPK